MATKHVKVSGVADSADATKIQPTDWNADHTGTNVHDHTTADGSGVLTADEHDSYSQWTAVVAPTTPAAGKGRLYFSTVDKKLHAKDDAGVDTALGASGAAGAADPHGAAAHTGDVIPAANQLFGAFYAELDGIATPTPPAAGSRRVFVDTSDGKLKVRTSAGVNVSLEEQGGTITNFWNNAKNSPYNAVGDGVADDTAAIQSWLNACAGGGKGYLPPGTYKISSTLTIAPRTHISGSGADPFVAGPSRLQAATGMTSDLMKGSNIDTADYWSHGVVIENMEFRGVGRTAGVAGSGLRFSPGDNTILRNLNFHSFPESGVRFQKFAAPGHMDVVDVYNNKWGFWFDNCGGEYLLSSCGGDDNDQMVNIEDSNNDPNTNGRARVITFVNIKAETSNGGHATAHSPLIRMMNANECILNIVGGMALDAGSASSGAKTFIRIYQNATSNAYSAQVNLIGIELEKYVNLIVDDVKTVTIPWLPFSGAGSDDYPYFRKASFNYRLWERKYSSVGDTPRMFEVLGDRPGITMHHQPTGAKAYWSAGPGTPEAVVTAPIGSLYSRTDGGAGTSLYVKQSGVGNTGWVGK